MTKNFKVKLLKIVSDFVLKLSVNDKACIDNFVKLLETHGFQLRYPYNERIKEDLYCLRVKGDKKQIRIFYFYYVIDGIFWLVHAFVKKAKKIPPNEIKTALKRVNRIKKGEVS